MLPQHTDSLIIPATARWKGCGEHRGGDSDQRGTSPCRWQLPSAITHRPIISAGSLAASEDKPVFGFICFTICFIWAVGDASAQPQWANTALG